MPQINTGAWEHYVEGKQEGHIYTRAGFAANLREYFLHKQVTLVYGPFVWLVVVTEVRAREFVVQSNSLVCNIAIVNFQYIRSIETGPKYGPVLYMA